MHSNIQLQHSKHTGCVHISWGSACKAVVPAVTLKLCQLAVSPVWISVMPADGRRHSTATVLCHVAPHTFSCRFSSTSRLNYFLKKAFSSMTHWGRWCFVTPFIFYLNPWITPQSRMPEKVNSSWSWRDRDILCQSYWPDQQVSEPQLQCK